MIRKLLHFFKGYRLYAILCPVAMVLEVVADVFIPRLMATIVDVGLANRDFNFVVRYGFFMMGVALIALTCGTASSYLGAKAGQGFGANLRRALFDKIQQFSFASLDQFSVPSLITRLTTDTNRLSLLAQMSLRMMIRSPSMLMFAFIMAFRINARLSLVFVAATILVLIATTTIMKRAFPIFSKAQEQLDDLNGVVQENLTNIRVVKAFVREDKEREKFRTRNQNLFETFLQGIYLMVLFFPILTLIINGCIISVLWFGGNAVRSGTMLTGDLISYITYIMQIMMSLMMLAMLFIQFTRGKASADRVVEVLDAPIDLTSPEEGQTTIDDGSITFENVCFNYPGASEHALSDISFEIKSGEIIGVVGGTGSGKTSLLQLIPRLYDVAEGRVLVSGIDVRHYDLTTLRDGVAFVLQKNTLFSGTIRSNMQWGDAEATDEMIIDALKTSQIWSFVESLPEQLDAPVEQGGANFSGGQRQRLCIARALLKKPNVIILDDAMSALDLATSRRLNEAFQTDLKDVTVLIVSQRLAALSHADRIMVLDNGKLNGFDTADVLAQNNTIFQEILSSQQEGAIAE